MIHWLAIIWACLGIVAIGFTVIMVVSMVGIGIELAMSFLDLKRERKGLNDVR